MNTQRIDAIIQLIQSLPPEEQQTVITRLTQPNPHNAAHQLAKMGGTEPNLNPIPRRSYLTENINAHIS